MRHESWPLVSVLVLCAVAMAAFAVSPWGSGPTGALLNDASHVVVGLLSTLLARRVAGSPRLCEVERRAWRRLAAAYLTCLVADILWLYYAHLAAQLPSPGPPDLFYILYYVLLLWGLLSLPMEPRPGHSRTLLLDGATVLLGGGMVIWYFLLGPAAAVQTDAASKAASLAYPIGDLLLLFGITAISVRQPGERSRAAIGALTASLFAELLADLIFGARLLQGHLATEGWSSALELVSWGMLGVAAYLYDRDATRATPPLEEPTVATASSLPYVAVAVGYAALLLGFFDRSSAAALESPTVTGLVVGAVALTSVVLLRQAVAIRDNLRLRAEQVARSSEQRFRSLVQNSSDVIVVVDRDAAVRYLTPSAERLIGIAPELLLGSELLALAHPDDVAGARRLLLHAEQSPGEAVRSEWRVRRHAGGWRFVQAVAVSLLDDPAIAGIVITMRDVSERKTLEEQLTHQAFHDSLTGLANRALFTDRVEHAVVRCRRDEQSVTVLLLDLDDFKRINDGQGHGAGDEVLIEVGRRLTAAVRTSDTVARLGGDEFAVLLEAALDEHEAATAAGRIAESLRTPVQLAGQQVFVSASIGIATSELGHIAADELLRNADVAMYNAKAGGKNAWRAYRPSMHERVLEHIELEAALRTAIERGEFVLEYQPIVALQSGRIVAAEALVRWQHPERGRLEPESFIGFAEETGLIVPIGRWVLEQACREAQSWPREWRGEYETPYLTVNLSARQLQEPDIVAQVAAALRASQLAPQRLVLEITESAMMLERQAVIERLLALKQIGVRIAIDDFGTGYSSLSYIQYLPIDILKVDKSFVEDLVPETPKGSLARGIVELAKAMGLVTVAEGIELPAQAEALRRFCCELGQGYYFARPAPAAAMRRLLDQGRLTPGEGPRGDGAHRSDADRHG